MASLEKHRDSYRIIYYVGGKKRRAALRTTSEKQANADLVRFEENLRLLERGRLILPNGADLSTFLLSDGKLTDRPKIKEALTLEKLKGAYLEAHPVGILEKNTRLTITIHFKHLTKTFGRDFDVAKVTLAELQRHVNRRAKDKGLRKKPLSADTIKKDISTFRASWNWAKSHDHVQGEFPCKGLRYPKRDEKPPFMTHSEIVRKIQANGIADAEAKDFWDCLYLTSAEVREVLEVVRNGLAPAFLYPMLFVAAHTGARRSELLRAKLTDIDIEAGTILLREKKRSQSQRTLRQVPLTIGSQAVLKYWLKEHPGGSFLFTADGESAITKDEAHHHLKHTLSGTKWKVIRGWHTFRHSFISNAASNRVDQRMIDQWTGHSTEEMRRRYRHLLPDVQRDTIACVYG